MYLRGCTARVVAGPDADMKYLVECAADGADNPHHKQLFDSAAERLQAHHAQVDAHRRTVKVAREKLHYARKLRDAGEITQETYLDKERQIMSEF